MGRGVSWEQRACLHCGGTSLIAGRTAGQTGLRGKEEGGGFGSAAVRGSSPVAL